jgi:hypothetical protein
MDTGQVLIQLLLMAGLLALPFPLLWMEARALQRVPRLASQPQWRERSPLVERAPSVGVAVLAAAALTLFIYYRLSPLEGLQALLTGHPLGQGATVRVDGSCGLLATVGSVTWGNTRGRPCARPIRLHRAYPEGQAPEGHARPERRTS